MGDVAFPHVDREQWMNLTELCTDPKDQQALAEYINEVAIEWQSLFGRCYPDKTISLSQMSNLVTGIARASSKEYAQAATLIMILFDEDPNRYWARVTRFITVFFTEDLNVMTICKSSIPPRYTNQLPDETGSACIKSMKN